MAFENMDTGVDAGPETEPTAGGPPEEGNNRTFLLVAGGIGVLIVLSLLCLGGFFVASYLPKIRSDSATRDAAYAQNTAIALGITQTAEAGARTATPTATRAATATPPPSVTPVVASPQATWTTGPDPRTATVAALLTQAAEAQKTPVQPTSTLLPQGGFADEVREWGVGIGLPGLLGLAVVFVVVIFMARKLRSS